MKKEHLISALLFTIMLSGIASAVCALNVNMINQDPYPATPGESVEVVFQINGTETTECNEVSFDIIPEHPFSVEESDTRTVIAGGTYILGYQSFLLKAYKLRVDENALDGDSRIRVAYGSKTGSTSAEYTKDFYINIKDSRSDFDVSVQDYDATKNTITFGIINIGKYDAESLTLEFSEQENLDVIGGNTIIIGSLNSNDDTTATLEAIPKAGNVKLKLSYNDQNDVRRTIDKEVYIPQRLITNGAAAVQPKGIYYYLFWGLVIIVILWMIWGYFQRRKAKNNRLALLNHRK